MKFIPLIGRILFSLMFIMSGMGHLTNTTGMAMYAGSMGVPGPTLLVIISGIMIVVGGFSVLLGYKVKIGTILLVVFLIPTSFIMHPFWAIEDPMQSQIQMVMFFKNLSMLGGALLFYYFGTGPLSLEEQTQQ
ncbi:MAG: DoxX family protein [Candidatus Marinimicrobia bacterium]|nr:DoxX family protein [Candidatus Neomarinimicrobiota bacterium]